MHRPRTLLARCLLALVARGQGLVGGVRGTHSSRSGGGGGGSRFHGFFTQGVCFGVGGWAGRRLLLTMDK